MRIRLLLLVGISAIPLFFLILIMYRDQIQVAETTAIQETAQITQITATTQEGLLSASEEYLAALSRIPEVLPENAAACNALFQEITQEQGTSRYLNFGVATPDGNIYCSSSDGFGQFWHPIFSISRMVWLLPWLGLTVPSGFKTPFRMFWSHT